MPDDLVCDQCQTEIPLLDIVTRYIRMREVAPDPDTKVSAVVCPTCLRAIPLTGEQFDAVRSAADRALEVIDRVGDPVLDDPLSRYAAMLLLLAHELGLTPGHCAEEHIVARVRELVADRASGETLVARIRKQRDASNGQALRLAASTTPSPTVAEHRAVAQAMQSLLMFAKRTPAPADNQPDEDDGVLPS